MQLLVRSSGCGRQGMVDMVRSRAVVGRVWWLWCALGVAAGFGSSRGFGAPKYVISAHIISILEISIIIVSRMCIAINTGLRISFYAALPCNQRFP